jgi:hypothetical protein
MDLDAIHAPLVATSKLKAIDRSPTSSPGSWPDASPRNRAYR